MCDRTHGPRASQDSHPDWMQTWNSRTQHGYAYGDQQQSGRLSWSKARIRSGGHVATGCGAVVDLPNRGTVPIEQHLALRHTIVWCPLSYMSWAPAWCHRLYIGRLARFFAARNLVCVFAARSALVDLALSAEDPERREGEGNPGLDCGYPTQPLPLEVGR